MRYSEIQDILTLYTKDEGFTKDQIKIICTLCDVVERTTRQECVSAAYDLANKLAVSPRNQDKG